MKQYFLGICSILLICSCSPDSDPITTEPESLEVDLQASSLSIAVDEMATITVNSDTPLQEIAWIGENFTRTHSTLTEEGLPGDTKLYFQFPNPGVFPVQLKFTGTNGKTVNQQLEFEVVRGNTVQIKGIEINNFYRKGETWDQEFSEDDQERLADMIIGLEKLHHSNLVKKEFIKSTWYISDVHENESSFTWDLSEEQLFLNPLLGFHLGLGDVDEGNIGENLMVTLPSYFIDLRPEMENKPATISLIDESVDLDITIFLDWK